ncbi:stage III sporulation protein SpoIIIAF [Ruminiclostridium hungatei]|uniref:Stage III sporulation protein SpoIIIAF n=1 Tax=Ruminiclostridium hungatei TaxID=48256 RepID=A0A1V4SI10_RUMHU|nr:stage III sporulation protein AF [Ruminiclostridium hungatei]OPX43444.1 stage III sporulation protein SpoIIIAF [Ruminiclostridium hungatei]
MLEFMRHWIINIVTISIILILFEIVVPSGKIKKIITLVSGFILLIAVVNPLIKLKDKSFDLNEAMLSDSYYIDRKEVETGSRLLEETQARQISTVYKRKLTTRIEEETNRLEGVNGSKALVVINEDFKSEKFGEITKISVEIKKAKSRAGASKIEPVATVERIDIKAQSGDKEEKGKDKDKDNLKFVDPEDKRLTELVKQNLNKSLEISKDNIEVTIT